MTPANTVALDLGNRLFADLKALYESFQEFDAAHMKSDPDSVGFLHDALEAFPYELVEIMEIRDVDEVRDMPPPFQADALVRLLNADYGDVYGDFLMEHPKEIGRMLSEREVRTAEDVLRWIDLKIREEQASTTTIPRRGKLTCISQAGKSAKKVAGGSPRRDPGYLQ